MLSTDESKTALRKRARSLSELLQPRIAVEDHFGRVGHTYRHGRFYRSFEHYVTRPLLKAGLQLSGLYAGGMRNALSPVVRRLTLQFNNLPAGLEGFQILHLSDFHIDGTEGLTEALVEAVAPLRPDVCLMTGDYRFEDRGSAAAVYPLMREILAGITARHGVFGILGNHDSAEIALQLENMGVHMLVNDAAEIIHNRESLWLLGVDDPFDFQTDDLDLALAAVPDHRFKILLAHAPELYEEAARAGIDLYLSGHTHAGQIRVPVLGSLRHNADCPREYSYGHWVHQGMQGYTSAGVGCSSLPIRFGCPPEAVMIELTRNTAAGN